MKCPNILVAVDGSDQSLWAAEYVVDYFSPGLADITLFHVFSKMPDACWDLEAHPGIRQSLAGMRAWESAKRKEVENLFQKVRHRCFQSGYSEEQFSAVIADRKAGVARDIALQARQGYHALVLGRTGLSRVKDILLGSVADKLLGKLAGVPLWIVGGQPNTERFLVAFDNSPGVHKAVDYVMKMAVRPNIDITFCNIRREILPFVDEYSEMAINDMEKETNQTNVVDAMEEALHGVKEKMVSAGWAPEKIGILQIQNVPSRARALVEQAMLGDFGTIVVGRRGLSGVREFFMGRVSNKVMRLTTKCAVWVIG